MKTLLGLLLLLAGICCMASDSIVVLVAGFLSIYVGLLLMARHG